MPIHRNKKRRVRKFPGRMKNAMLKKYTAFMTHWRLSQRAAGMLVLAIFLTSVTIASIAPHDPLLAGSVQGLIATPPPQVINGMGDRPKEAGASPTAVARPPATAPENLAVEGKWAEIKVRKGDTLSDILKQAGHDDGEITRVVQTNPEARALYQIHPGQILRLRADASGRLQELSLDMDLGETMRLVRAGPQFDVIKETRQFETRIAHITGTIESSLFEDGQEAGLADALIMKVVEIFGWDIDFALDLRRGDSFSVIHEEKYWQGQKIADGPILAAEFVSQGKVYRAIGYHDASGFTSYYTPEGMSMRRQFLRTPVEFSRITSRFSSGRFHPILKTWRAHNSVDYGAPVGTPVRATSMGKILSLGLKGGYGKCIIIRHGGAYSTLYAHLSRFNTNIRVGSYVEQGQIIGYVGQTGLATGPHLHYEFQVNGEHRNPLTYKFPGSTPIAAENRQDFERTAQIRMAQLDLIGRGTRVASGK
jgi:murein DD-endopeptidase MepM/ murein hydrolase activator NlpD